MSSVTAAWRAQCTPPPRIRRQKKSRFARQHLRKKDKCCSSLLPLAPLRSSFVPGQRCRFAFHMPKDAYRDGGSRGGQDQFKWEDVKTDKYRDNYLGHSAVRACCCATLQLTSDLTPSVCVRATPPPQNSARGGRSMAKGQGPLLARSPPLNLRCSHRGTREASTGEAERL